MRVCVVKWVVWVSLRGVVGSCKRLLGGVDEVGRLLHETLEQHALPPVDLAVT